MRAKRLQGVCVALVVLALSHAFIDSMFTHRVITGLRNNATCAANGVDKFRVDKVVLVLVDALTPVVATGDPRRPDVASFSYIRDHLFSHAEHEITPPYADCAGFFSVADAPTTTSQRLKAITTGTIPAFLEAGSNFNADVVEDDSLIHQLNGSASILGDDTWMRLFPRERTPWRSVHVYPSFDVRDLNTVDNGVLSHLWAELTGAARTTNESALVVAHFLGVDHAGHSYHAHHPLLNAKVAQLNAVLRNITVALRRRAEEQPMASATLLVVMGDHGMTASGDHGGGSPEETDTFLYSEVFAGRSTKHDGGGGTAAPSTSAAKMNAVRVARELAVEHSARRRQSSSGDLRRLLSNPDLPETNPYAADLFAQTSRNAEARRSGPWHGVSVIHQIDLVPTLALMLGVPIPRSNAGRLIPELLLLAAQHRPSTDDEDTQRVQLRRALLDAARCNERQLDGMAREGVNGYTPIGAGEDDAGSTDAAAFDAIWIRLDRIVSQTRFAFGAMDDVGLWFAAALQLAVVVIASQVVFAERFAVAPQRKWRVAMFAVLGVAILAFGFAQAWGGSAVSRAPTIVAVLIFTLFVATLRRCGDRRHAQMSWRAVLLGCATSVVMILRVIVPISNSCIVDEETVVVFLFATTLCVRVLSSLSPTKGWAAWAISIAMAARLLVLAGQRDRSFAEVHMQPTSPLRRVIDEWFISSWVCGNPLSQFLWERFADFVYHSSAVHIVSGLCFAFAVAGCRVRVLSPTWPVAVVLVWITLLAKIETALPRAAHTILVAALVSAMRSRVEVKSPVQRQPYGGAAAFPTHSASGTRALDALSLHLLSWIGFFASGNQTIFTSIDWHAAFVGVTEYSMVAGAILVSVNTAAPFIITPLCVRWIGGRRLSELLHPRLLAIHVFHAAVTTVTLAQHRRHLMVWDIFMPYYVFVLGALLAAVGTVAVLAVAWH